LQAFAFSARATRGATTARSRRGPTRARYRARSLGHFEVRSSPFFKSIRFAERSVRVFDV
jgi:hypothetical protein